jgi:hypothetical protein
LDPKRQCDYLMDNWENLNMDSVSHNSIALMLNILQVIIGEEKLSVEQREKVRRNSKIW